MRKSNKNSDQSTKSPAEHPHNPCRTCDKITPTIPQFPVSIPLETDENLCPRIDHSIKTEGDKSNPLKMMMDKRTLLRNDPTSSGSSATDFFSRPCGDLTDFDNIANIRGDDLVSDIHCGANKNFSNSSGYTTYDKIDDRSTYVGDSGAPISHFIGDVGDNQQFYTLPESRAATFMAVGSSSDYSTAITSSEVSGFYKGVPTRDRAPYLPSNQRTTVMDSHFPPADFSQQNYVASTNYNVENNNYLGYSFVAPESSRERSANVPSINEYYSDYQPPEGGYNQRDSSTTSNPQPTVEYNKIQQVNNEYARQSITVESVRPFQPHKDDPDDQDSTDSFVDQIARIYITERPTPRDQTKTKPCNCQKTGCLKLYCECFARGDSCFNCSCKCCLNTPNDHEHWLKASNLVKSRRKTLLAMAPKNSQGNKLRRGCNCRRSLCLKKYCECYDKKIPCTKYCHCVDCCNGPDSQHVRKHAKAKNNDSLNYSANAVAASSGDSSVSRVTCYTDPNNIIFYSDVQSSVAESSNRYQHNDHKNIQEQKATPTDYPDSSSVIPIVQTHPTHGTHSKHHSSRIHYSQSSNDLINTPKNSNPQLIPHIPPYTKSNSTPNLLTAYSVHNPANKGGETVEFSSSGKLLGHLINSGGIYNKKVMNQYLNLLASNPDHTDIE